MTIRFLMRKYEHRTFDSSYNLKNGKDFNWTPDWHMGDIVDVMFDATEEHEKAVRNLGRFDMALSTYGGKITAHIPCKVVSRRHAIAWEEVGTFQGLGLSILLQAEAGLWEDLLAWIIVGERPDWAAE